MCHKQCVFDAEKFCNQCQECLVCDLNPHKICDNCCQCFDKTTKDFETIMIDEIII